IDCDRIGRHLTNALDAGKQVGLREALDQGTIQRVIRRSHGGLCVLTAGNARAHDASVLSSTKMGAMLAEARQYFEVILVDSGPILGSLVAAWIEPHVVRRLLS